MVPTFLVLYVVILGFFPFMMLTIAPLLIAGELGAPDATLPLALAVGLLLPVPLARAALRTRVFTTAAALMADLDRWKARRRANRVPRDSADPDADQMHR